MAVPSQNNDGSLPSSKTETLKGKSLVVSSSNPFGPSSSLSSDTENGEPVDYSTSSVSTILADEVSLTSLQTEAIRDQFLLNDLSSNPNMSESSYILDSHIDSRDYASVVSPNGSDHSLPSSLEALDDRCLVAEPLDQRPVDTLPDDDGGDCNEQMEFEKNLSSSSGLGLCEEDDFCDNEQHHENNGLFCEQPYNPHDCGCSEFHRFGCRCRPCGRDCRYNCYSRQYSPWYRSRHSPWADSWNGGNREDKEYVPLAFSLPLPEPVATGVGAGLSNLGNTCFINAILQCFTHTVPLVKALQSCNHLRPCQRGTGGFCVVCALHDHIKLSLASSGKIISPLEVVDNLNNISSCFRRYQQEDAHEFLQCLLEKLERCCLNDEISYPQDDNIVERVFGGRLISKLKCCNCGDCSDKYEPLIDLSLEIEDVETLQNALESFTKVEKIENLDTKFTCDKCREEVSREKQLMLDRAPSVATFHLKRFKTDGSSIAKINKHVDFPLELDLKPYTNGSEDSNVNQVDLKYQLYAIVVHNGFLPTSGHYFSYVRSSPDTWHKLDDSMVVKVDEEIVLSQTAYILFYAREGTPWFSSLIESLDPIISNTSPKSVLDRMETECSLYHNLENVDHCKDHGTTSDVVRTSTHFSMTTAVVEAQMNETGNDAEGVSAMISNGTGQSGPQICSDESRNDSDIPMNDVSASLGVVDWSNGTAKSEKLEETRTDIPMEASASLGARDWHNGLLKREKLEDIRVDGILHSEKLGALPPVKENNLCQVVHNIGRKDGLGPLTPPRSPVDMNSGGLPETRHHIRRDHLKVENSRREHLENMENCKKLKRGVRDQRHEAIRYISKNVPSARGIRLMAAMLPRNDKKRRLRSSPCKQASPPSSRHKPNQRLAVLR
ncbi:hypothetical protein JCGZ_12656 [Jatropha curcas]|uniref:Ubiquitin carboxyl-terminal hydrolase n=2 Tax=Jatropha curcas TaxID=180498 RepID=A0A067KH48_JATCU|nr:hypothetical protein JCGZ_12656 [Jatropha curcas]